MSAEKYLQYIRTKEIIKLHNLSYSIIVGVTTQRLRQKQA